MSFEEPNIFRLVGNLGDDPKEITTDKSKFTVLTLAQNKFKKNESTNEWEKLSTNWFEVLCFKNIGTVAASLEKGDRIMIFGELSTKTNKVENTNVSSICLVGKSIKKIEKISSKKIEDGLPNFFSNEEIKF